MDWFKPKTAQLDFWIAGGTVLPIWWWMGAVLHLPGLLAVWAGIFGATQLVRFIGAQLATLEWARLNAAVLVEKKMETAPRVDQYRQASVIDEPASADDEYLAREVPRRRRNARLSLGIIGAIAALGVAIPSLVFGYSEIPVAGALLTALMGVFYFTMLQMRRKHAERADYFMQHLERDTKALLAKQKGAPAEPVHLRVGVDFGVPAEELDEEAERKRDEA